MPDLAERLLQTIRKQRLMAPGDRVAVAVSGGSDSVALLLLLNELRSELGIVLSVAHVNHKLRGEESDADERFVVELARSHGFDLYAGDAPLDPADSGIEAAARELRYDFFRQIAAEHRVSKIATAHTLDDQAETVLLRILRGTGIRGLAGIHPRRILAGPGEQLSSPRAEVIRPVLGFRRDELREFLHVNNRIWREDSSNRDPGFLRNRIRHEVLPFLSTLSGSVAENLSDLAEIGRVEDEHWTQGHPEILADGGQLDVKSVLSLPLASRRRLILNWLNRNAADLSASFRQVEEILDLAHSSAGKKLELPAGYCVSRSRDQLCLESLREQPHDYEYSLALPGKVVVPELGVCIETALVDPNSVRGAERDQLLDPGRLPPILTVRNWRAGDRFWPAHTKEPKKVKDLLNDRHISGAEKKLWPVIAGGVEPIWLRGFPVPAAIRPAPGSHSAVLIREIRIGRHS